MKQGIGISHAKVIFMGEHSVVYHQLAIALPFKALTCQVTILPSSHNTMKSDLYTGELKDAPRLLYPIIHLFNTLQAHFNLSPLELTIQSSIPFSAGLGSSAALASAMTKAFYDYTQTSLDDHTLFNWVQQAETIAHGNPSGIDALTTSFDYAWVYTKGTPPQPLTISLPATLIIAQSPQAGSTKEAVELVAEYVHSNGIHLIETLGSLTKQAQTCIQHQDIKTLGSLMNQAHDILKALNISTPTLDHYVDIARYHHALGAKLTGGGLGGCMIALAEDQHVLSIVDALKQETPYVWSINLQ
ncbi:MAG: mevalonate kinase [Erysipelotrichaceae bacterium]|nr:mevalonate kinase [Erysipelotrichaceae bacterium]